MRVYKSSDQYVRMGKMDSMSSCFCDFMQIIENAWSLIQGTLPLLDEN